MIPPLRRDHPSTTLHRKRAAQSRSVGHPGCEQVPAKDWIRIPDHHPSIIPRELFDAAHSRLETKREPRRQRTVDAAQLVDAAQRYASVPFVLKNKVVCGHCGHAMRLDGTRNAAFHCRFTRSVAGAACHRLKIPKGDLEEAVLERVRRHAQMILDAGPCSDGGCAARSPVALDYAARMERIHEEKQRLYEDLVTGAASREAYKERKTAADAELERMAPIYETILAENQSNVPDAACIDAAKTVLEDDTLTPKQVDLLIDRVLVFPGQRMEISWKLPGFQGAQTCKRQTGRTLTVTYRPCTIPARHRSTAATNPKPRWKCSARFQAKS